MEVLIGHQLTSKAVYSLCLSSF